MDDVKTCGRCRALKPLSDFAWRRIERSQRDNLCRTCRSDYKREHYAANRARYIEQARDRKRALARERSSYLVEFFKTHPCVDCGETDPVVLEFDHLGDKSFTIGSSLSYRNWQSILEEIAKCEVVCANCHRRRTASRGGHVRVLLTRPAARDSSG